MFELLCIGLLSLIVIKIIMVYFGKAEGRLPPGPKGWPLIGNMLSMMDEPGEYLASLSAKYGPILTIHFGSKPAIILNDYETIKKMMKMKHVHFRPQNGIYQDFSKGLGLGMSNGPLWASNRKIVLQHFSEVGKDNMENTILEEMKKIINILKNKAKKREPVEISELMMLSTCNVTFSLFFDKSFSYDDPELIECTNGMEASFKYILMCEVMSKFRPWIKPLSFGLDRIVIDGFDKVRKLSNKLVAETKVKLEESGDLNKDMLIPRYMAEIKNEQKLTGSNNNFFNAQLVEVITDLFAGGTETVNSYLRWSLLYIMENKDATKRMKEEMNDVVGPSNLPNLFHQSRLPYTMACIQEIERLSSIAPLAAFHNSEKAFDWGKYYIPKDMDIIYNILSVHNDPKLWKDPEVFNPSRFLDDQDNVFRPEYLIPFGTGRRSCPGEILGKMEIYLYLTTLVHLFDFEAIPGEPTTKSKVINGLTRVPHKYKLYFNLVSQK